MKLSPTHEVKITNHTLPTCLPQR